MTVRPRTIGIVTVARSDYGIYQPLLQAISQEQALRLWIYAGGMHLSKRHGSTLRMIKQDGFEIAGRANFSLPESESPAEIAIAMGRGVSAFARAFAARRPDLLVVLGDRYDMHAAALAALPMKIPVAHIHGGELTEGAMDDALRHCITKLSHLHFPSTAEYARRIRQLGEPSWRITRCGAPALDRLRHFKPLSQAELEKRFDLDLSSPVLLATFHPVTLEYENTAMDLAEFLGAISDSQIPAVFTLPNADTHGRIITSAVRTFISKNPKHRLVENFGADAYFSMMHIAAAMVGNSSSGIIEAPSFGLPVVNVGNRQRGRVRAKNVIDVPPQRKRILAAIRRATGPAFQAARKRSKRNPYGDGQASRRIVKRLCDVEIDDRLLSKRFNDRGVSA
jgi:UDP-hydrolysing UDP-N-acetyl-D-glucosamine 2-epimerase